MPSSAGSIIVCAPTVASGCGSPFGAIGRSPARSRATRSTRTNANSGYSRKPRLTQKPRRLPLCSSDAGMM